ncbi:MAG: asparagine synthase (glutamine-hydrolyzing) [Alphaproteobacteria bacterium]|nr:asparagine synthase (glutamine-hydrolyzing) [Alphaproteobacteria bacterium]MDD9919963.1 asparagine synthase (glutamine-hydrolyzing) [Alphaproteobacteria bacterium]
MCGIVGTLVTNGVGVVEPSILEKMRDAMHLRGPDGGGLWLADDKKAGFGHRRLAIVDLTPEADQPMVSECGKVVLTFNGEIYNHADIRAELMAEGVTDWRTDHSDTEALLQAYMHWGLEGCLQRLRGMFAFSVWDTRGKPVLHLVRDRMGIKPLYYMQVDGQLHFASEIKALLINPAQVRKVNEEALFHYLTFLTTPAPMTLFEGIHKLANGTYLTVDENGESVVTRYYDPLTESSMLNFENDEAYASGVQEKLREAVTLRKMADVPVGTFLSGGIDSSTITSLFAEGTEKGQVKSFCVGYAGEDNQGYANEFEYAHAVVDHAGTEHHDVRITQQELLDFVEEMVWLQDEPIADPSCAPIYFVSAKARAEGIIVAQSGEGADEIFIGYEDWRKFFNLMNYNSWPVPTFLKKAVLRYLEKSGKGYRFYTEYLRRAIAKKPIFWGGAEAFTETEKRVLLSDRLRQKFADTSSSDIVEKVRERFVVQDKVKQTTTNWMSYMDLNMRLPEQLLMRTDKMSMGTSLEVRVPFLDHHVVEFGLGIPESVKFRGKVLKSILKKAVRPLIPHQIIDRRKQGLGIPLHGWLLEQYGERAEREIKQFCDETDMLDWQQVQRLFEEKRAQHIWYLLNLALWWKTFIKPEVMTFPNMKKAAA